MKNFVQVPEKFDSSVQEMLKKQKKVVISIDPGFDSFKMVVNGVIFKLPSLIIDKRYEKEISSVGLDENAFVKLELSYMNEDNKQLTYIIGDEVNRIISFATNEEVAKFVDNFKKPDRFTMKEFGLLINAYIIYTLNIYSELNDIGFKFEDIDKWDIIIGVALPHADTETMWGNVKEYLLTCPELTITDNDKRLIKTTFKPNENNLYKDSQLLSAFKGMAFNDDGQLSEDNLKELDSLLPAVLNDGGYLTVGLGFIRNDFSVQDAHSDKTHFAMSVVDTELAAKLTDWFRNNDCEGTLSASNIPEILDSNRNFYAMESNAKKRIKLPKAEIIEMREAIIQEKSKQLYDYIGEKYPMSTASSVINIGGTAAKYHEHLVEYYKDYDEDMIVKLIEPTLYGTKPGYEFTVSVGYYKMLLTSLYAE